LGGNKRGRISRQLVSKRIREKTRGEGEKREREDQEIRVAILEKRGGRSKTNEYR